MPFRLVPEILNTIDMIMFVSKEFRMVDPVMLEVRDIQHIIPTLTVSIGDVIRNDLAFYNRVQCL